MHAIHDILAVGSLQQGKTVCHACYPCHQFKKWRVRQANEASKQASKDAVLGIYNVSVRK
jgi:hypothetical protein